MPAARIVAIVASPIGLLAVAAVAPPTLLSVAFGPRLTDASGALLPLAGAMTCLGATVLFTHYPLALASRAIPAALGITTVGAVAPIAWAGGSPVTTARLGRTVQALLGRTTVQALLGRTVQALRGLVAGLPIGSAARGTASA
jgi:hypothetical protein